MSRKRNPDGIPGSIFVRKSRDTKKLIIALYGKQYHTGLDDNPANRKLAQLKKRKIYLELMGLGEQTSYVVQKRTIRVAWSEFESEHLYNLAPKTIATYKASIAKITTINKSLTTENLEKDILYFVKNSTGLAPSSKNIHLRHFQTFTNFCYKKKYIADKVDMKKYYQKAPKKKVYTYTNDELYLMFEYWNSRDREFSLMIQFMVHTGSRITETLEMKWSQIDSEWITFYNKVNKNPELFPISKVIRGILDELPKDRLKVFRWSPTSKSVLTRRFATFFDDVEFFNSKGMEPVIRNGRNFHVLRKTFRRNLFERDVPLDIATELMRHSSVDVTREHYIEYMKKEKLKYLED